MMSGREELLPCPFCGGEAHTRAIHNGYRGHCINCQADGPPLQFFPGESADEEIRAITVWNTRHLPFTPALAEENERLRGELRWIDEIASKEYEQDEKLRSQGARTLKRISDRARAALQEKGREG